MKRLFAVFVIVMMLFVVGCQSNPMVNVKVNEDSESIFFISDENITNAGIVKNENQKDEAYGRYNLDEDNVADIAKAAVNDSGNILIQPADDVHISTDAVKYDDVSDSINGKDTEDARSDTDENISSYPETTESSGIPTVSAAEQNQNHAPILLWSSDTTQNNRPESAPKHTPTHTPTPTPAPTPTPTPASIPTSTPAFFQVDENNTLIYYSGTETTVTIPDDVMTIGPDAFKENKNISSVIIPKSVKRIYSSAFEDCTSLNSVIFSDSSTLKAIDSSAFEGCSNLSSIRLSDSILQTDDTSLQLPHTIAKIGDNAFKDTALAGSICFYAEMVFIGQNAFENTHINKIILDPSSQVTLEVSSYAFANCFESISIELANSDSSLILYDNAFYNVENVNIYVANIANRIRVYPNKYKTEYLGITGDVLFLKP